MIRKHILDTESFRHILQSFGDKMTDEEIEDIFGEFEFDDDGNIFTKTVVDLFVAGAMDEKEEEKEEEKKAAEEAAPAAEGDGGKKKKKKKKAAK